MRQGVGKATGRRNRWRAERKNRKLSIRNGAEEERKGIGSEGKKEEATGNRGRKPKRSGENRRKRRGRKRKRASRGSHLQGRDGGRRKEIADEAAYT